MRFTGNIDAKVDEKGRVFVPSSFRKILQREDAAGLVLRRDVFQRCLVLYPAEVWNRQVDALILSRSGACFPPNYSCGGEKNLNFAARSKI